MKTILYNPIFINPQAYYVFPRLTRYLQPDNESTSEPANYIGTIEVKVIAYGDTTLKRTYTNTDSIDLSEFKNTWIRISLFTKVGSCVLGEWKIGNMESDLPYIDPEVLASLKAVVIVGNKTNNDSDRAIVKNLVDASNPFVISNAAFKLNSGFGKYETELSNTRIWTQSKETTSSPFSSNYNGLSGWIVFANTELTNSADMPSFKIQVKGLLEGQELIYRYYDSTGQTNVYSMTKDGKYTLPADVRTAKSLTSNTSGFQIVKNETNTITITQIPSFEGAFVTDGINDLITSTKTLQEMLGGSNEITVVSMIHQIGLIPSQSYARNNYFIQGNDFLTNTISAIGKIGIYGYKGNLSNIAIVNDILGDKKDYSVDKANPANIDSVFSVNGTHSSAQLSSVAWYWTIIANKVLTTDQINQVIAYFNLDRTLKPDILCNVKKQGITNENHAEFGDKLIDFSGNGRDIQLNNLAWDGDSGIGKYNYPNWKVTATIANTYSTIVNYPTVNGTYSINVNGVSELMQSIGLHLEIKYTTSTGIIYNDIKQDGVYSYILPDGATDLTLRFGGIPGIVNEPCNITITQIPSHAGALCLDGVNDFGKVTGMPIYKDYTVVTDREIFANIGAISSKNNPGAFVETAGNSVYSFGQATSGLNFISTRSISYLSKYSYCGQSITAGAAEDGTDMWLGTIRDNDSHFFNGAIYSLMSFPYSMSEFLIERQLKKHKLGTLYPDMVEFRPVIKANANYKITYYQIDSTNTWKSIKVGDYIVIGAKLAFQITFDNDASELKEVVSPQLSGIIVEKRPSNSGYNTYSYITSKSPQKINITIDEYIRFEDIVQPYPVLLRFKDENGNEVSWGGKFKVGSTITRIGSAADSNLLPNIYNIFGLLLNGNQVTSSKVIVEKTMVFKVKSAYIFDNNEPKCILSPRLLRIPNSSYKILGHIPDISGHGNHGKINNSAYAGMSGANGYKQDFTSWKTSGSSYSIVTDSKYILTNEKAITNGGYFLWNRLAKDSFKVKISNIPNGGWMSYRYKITEEDTQLSSLFIREDGIYTLPATVAGGDVDFFISTVSAPAKDWIGLTIEQIGEYEGAYCLDGVDDFITIPTLSSGGKQVLMKVNSRKSDCYLYDQRNNWTQYLGIVSTKDFIAYNYSNQRGKTYIDGILNENITANDLIGITHNITVTNNRDDVKQYSPCIGTSFARNSYAQMALYDFMLFDNISTDDKIKELNEYVGIEAKVELPPYYWDAYGKTNLDGDKATIQQRGVAVGDFDLTNNNFAYEGMSGYNGYPVVFGTNKTYANLVPNDGNFILTSSHNIINVTKFDTSYGLLYSHIKLDGKLTSRNIDYPSYKIKVTGLGENFGLHYSYLESSSDTTVKGFEINNDGIYIIPKSFASDGSLTSNSDWIGFIFTGTAPESCNVTIEVLPEYENGLVYDGITDYSKNANIPALDDFTAIIKREWLKKQGSPLIKGSKVYEGGNGNALLLEWDKAYNFVFYKRTDIMEGELPDNISFITPTNYNGNVITRGSEQDTNGICIAGDGNAGFANMVFYKLILYPKTIPLLQINFLKNLMKKDEIIDLNNPIFIQE